MKPHYGPGYGLDIKPPTSMSNEVQPAWQNRSIAGPKIRLVEFSAFLEQQRDADSVCTMITLLHSDWPKLCRVLAIQNAIGSNALLTIRTCSANEGEVLL